MSSSILHIITGLNNGGAEAVLYRLCAHDLADRHHVVSLMDGGKYGPMLEALGVPVTCLAMPRGRVTASGLWRLWHLLRSQRPDVVQTWMYHANLLGGLAAWLAGSRNIVWGIHHTDLDDDGASRSTRLVVRLGAWVSRWMPRRIICCAEKARGVHVAEGYDPRRINVVTNGYDLSVFRPDPGAGRSVRAELGIGDQAVIGFVARHDPQKDHDNLLRALKVLHEKGLHPLCLLVGPNMDQGNQTLVSRIESLGLAAQVRLLGPRNDIPAVMNALDLHVMSSAFGEAFPNVLAEAMACGTPCVSTDVGDAAAIVGNTGWIVSPRHPEALADAIAAALDLRGTADWAERKTAARERVANRFSIERMVDNYRSIWFGDEELRADRA